MKIKENEVKHIGVLGMHWGHRRGSSESKSSTPRHAPFSKDYEVANSLKKKKLSELSNDEIKTLAARVQLEQQYKSLNPDKLSSGKKKVNEAIGNIGKVTASAATLLAAYETGKKIYNLIPKTVAKEVAKEVIKS